MEVHHHSQTPRKKWAHYFWEFFMLFFAVFCGMLAEYKLEHIIEHQREKKYIRSIMIRRIHIAVIVTILFITSCATSMTPMQVNSTLPTLTKSIYISQAEADEK